MMSRWSSPMPSMTVWLVSSSRLKLKEGSSCASLMSPLLIFSRSLLLLGSMAILMTGSAQSDAELTCVHGDCLIESFILQPAHAHCPSVVLVPGSNVLLHHNGSSSSVRPHACALWSIAFALVLKYSTAKATASKQATVRVTPLILNAAVAMSTPFTE